MLEADATAVWVQAADCGRYSDERYSPECEKQEQVTIGALVVLMVLVLVIGLVVWRFWLRRLRDRPTPEGGATSA